MIDNEHTIRRIKKMIDNEHTIHRIKRMKIDKGKYYT